MPKVLHILNSLKHGGAENVALNYSIALKKLSYDSIWIAQKHSDDYESMVKSAGVDIRYGLSKSDFDNVNNVFIHSNQGLLKLIPYLFYIKKKNIKLFYIQHLNYSERKFRLLSVLINFICTDFIQITPITSDLVNRYIKIPIHFIVNFYINKYSEDSYPEIRKSVRKELNIGDNKTIVMFSSVFKPGKGLAEFLEIASVFRDDPKFLFLIIGDGEERHMVENYSYNNIICTGFVNDVEKYQIASDIYVFTSRFKKEMMPMALIEALNCRKPILAYKEVLINNFVLNNTYNSVDQMIVAIRSGSIKVVNQKYDINYAIDQLSNILNK